MTLSLIDQVREDKINHIADVMIEAALSEALSMMVGPKYILAAIDRVRGIVERLDKERFEERRGQQRLNELRAWLGMVTVPDAAATEKPAKVGHD